MLVGFITAGIKFVNALIAKQAQNQRIKGENLQTELKLIKTQINSAFLFKTNGQSNNLCPHYISVYIKQAKGSKWVAGNPFAYLNQGNSPQLCLRIVY
jgi:hypothetical protein